MTPDERMQVWRTLYKLRLAGKRLKNKREDAELASVDQVCSENIKEFHYLLSKEVANAKQRRTIEEQVSASCSRELLQSTISRITELLLVCHQAPVRDFWEMVLEHETSFLKHMKETP